MEAFLSDYLDRLSDPFVNPQKRVFVIIGVALKVLRRSCEQTFGQCCRS